MVEEVVELEQANEAQLLELEAEIATMAEEMVSAQEEEEVEMLDTPFLFLY